MEKNCCLKNTGKSLFVDAPGRASLVPALPGALPAYCGM